MAQRAKIYPTFVDGKYAHTSASQAKNWLQCPRIWYADKILKIKKPTTEAMLRGTAIHEAIEHYLLTGEVLDNDYAVYVEAAREHLDPLLAGSEFVVEGEMVRTTHTNGPAWIGYKDLEVVTHNEHTEVNVSILDYKSTSDRKYQKTPVELAEDLQLNSYAKQTFDDRPHLKTIRLGHLYLLTKNKKKTAWTVWTEVTRAEVDAVWAKTIDVVREITATVDSMGLQGDKFEDLKPNTDSCGAYGGCFFRNRCGIGSAKVNFSVQSLLRKKPTGENMPSLSEKLKAKMNGAKAEMPMTQISIVPPDAPSRNEFPPEEAEAKPTKATKGKKAKELNLDEFKTPTAPEVLTPSVEPYTKPAALTRRRLVIFEGCIPMKGSEYKDYVLYEDWVTPLMQMVADDHGVQDYRLVQYTSKAALATKIRENVASAPEVLVIGGYASGASEALEVLVPHATMYIKGIK